MKEPQNIHKHCSQSNVFTQDSTLLPVHYFEELKNRFGSSPCVYSCMEHGYQGNYYQTRDDLDKFNEKNNTNIKFLYSVEAYWVKDRFMDDRSNCHILLIAKNENGRKKLTKALSIANKEGYYFKPRLDLEMILSLPKDDIMVTTACIAFWNKYEDIEDIVLKLNNHFSSFYLEVQYHETKEQNELNKRMSKLSRDYSIPLIIGYDTHYITDQQKEDRDYLIKSHGITYEDEEDAKWFMDYPTIEEAIKRVEWHNIFTKEEIISMFDNTSVVLEFEDMILDKSFKVPVLKQYRNLSQEERNEELRKIVRKEWRLQEHEINQSKKQQYLDEIKDSLEQIEGCGMSDYFLLNYFVIKLGIEKYGGELTLTGRGSAVSMFLNKLLGFTNIDAINSPVTMFSSRFLTKERVLNSHQMVDIDFNVSSREPFMLAQKELLGELSAYDMYAEGKLKPKSAFKMYARANNLDVETQNAITKQIDKYESALKYADDEDRDDISLYDFISEQYRPLIDNSKHYLGIIESKKVHPCASLLLDGDIEEEVGIIRVKSDKGTGKDTLVALVTSGQIDNYGLLKNDILVVTVIGIIYDVYKEIGIKPLSINEILEVTKDNEKVWSLYHRGECVSLNQVEQPKTIDKVMNYKPNNPSELCQFIAGIRPSFMSMYRIFESRTKFEYGIKVLDEILQDEYRQSSFMIYQEDIMAILKFAGFDIGSTYDLIKAISKKKKYVFEEVKPKFLEKFSKSILDSKETSNYDLAFEKSEKIWKIIEDSASYGFNASHSYCVSLDSLQGAYLKAYYPLQFYKVILERFTKKGNKNKVTLIKKEMSKKGIKLKSARFGDDNRTFSIDYENNCINQTMSSIKGMSKITPNVLYELGQKKFDNALDLFVELDLSPLKKNDTLYMIKLNYYEEFGGVNYLINLWEQFNSRYKKTHVEKTKEKRLEELREYASSLKVETTQRDLLKYEVEILGYTDLIDESFDDMVYAFETIETNQYGTPFAMTYRVCDGERQQVKINRNYYNQNKIDKACLVKTVIKEQPKKIKNGDGKWVNSKELEKIIDVYCVL